MRADTSLAVRAAALASQEAAGNLFLGGRISLDLAERLIKEVEKKALEMGMRVVCAVSDGEGRPLCVRSMDGAFGGSYDVAVNKAYTSAAFQMSTQKLGSMSGPGQDLYGIQWTNQSRIVIFAGGVPLVWNGERIGAFGVSGGTAVQDGALADYALEVFGRLM